MGDGEWEKPNVRGEMVSQMEIKRMRIPNIDFKQNLQWHKIYIEKLDKN